MHLQVRSTTIIADKDELVLQDEGRAKDGKIKDEKFVKEDKGR